MKFSRYCKDRWVSMFIFAVVFAAEGVLLWLIGTPPAAACVVDGFCAAGFFLIFIEDYFSRKDFFNQLLEASGDLQEISCLTELVSEPSFQEGKLLYQILRRDEKYSNDRIAFYHRELQEYQEYVETWAHEIKTPVAVSRLILENHRDEVTNSLVDELDKLEGYVEQMLYYSKANSLQDDYRIREVPLKALVMGAVKKQARLMIAAQVTPRFENLEAPVLADTRWMNFVLGQLISNAVKYRSRERAAELVFSAVREKKTVTLFVADNGIGIAPEDLGRIFRKGFTGENGRRYAKSTGMGLYLCDTLCKKLGTQLEVSSVPGEGSVFSLKFTLAPEQQIMTDAE